jgi:LmbE family N-acetylglucosaminyl deacetylase
MEPLRLLCVMAHPDDETLGTGGVLARYAAEGVDTYLLTATRGEAGWFGAPEDYPGPEALGRLREGELRAAGRILGLKEIRLLDYRDGQLDRACPAGICAEIAAYLREIRPQVVVTFDPNGSYGHPDHIAISQFTTAAAVLAASPGFQDAHGRPPHTVTKLYYFADLDDYLAIYQEDFGELAILVDGKKRRAQGWNDWAITTAVDTREYRPVVWQAVEQHRSQITNYAALKQLPEAKRALLWGIQHFYRVYSLVNGGRDVEDDLFAGLRERPLPTGAALAAGSAGANG